MSCAGVSFDYTSIYYIGDDYRYTLKKHTEGFILLGKLITLKPHCSYITVLIPLYLNVYHCPHITVALIKDLSEVQIRLYHINERGKLFFHLMCPLRGYGVTSDVIKPFSYIYYTFSY